MRSTLRSLFPLAVVLSIAGCQNSAEEVHPTEKRVVILFTTDEHSQLFASSPELDDFLGATVSPGALKGGVERRMTVLTQQRAAATSAGKGTLTLSSGDFSQGSLASAAWLATSPELATMKLMGYDAAAIGNHEWDLGPAALAQAIGSAVTLDHTAAQRPQLVASNVIFDATDPADDVLAGMYGVGKPIAPYTVLTTSNGLKIGIVASIGVEAGTVAGHPAPVRFWPATATTQQAQFLAVAAQVQGAVNAVRTQGVDAVILLAHGGIATAAPSTGEDEKLAQFLTGVDLVLSGHSHLFTPAPRYMYGYGGSVPVVQPKPYGRNVGKIELVFHDYDPKVQLDPSATQFIDIDDTVAKTTDAAFVTDLHTRTIGFLELGLDQTATTLPSFLESTLSKITGATIHADPAHLGNLWNFPMGTGLPNGCALAFDVTDSSAGESNALNLDTDAIRAAVADATATTTEIGAQAFGPLRGGLLRGTTSQIGFADVYHMAPLGGDPTAIAPADMNPLTNPAGVQAYLNAVPGYPLVRINVPSVAMRLVFEGTLQTALETSGDFFVGVSGLEVKYDVSRPPLDLATVDPAVPATLLQLGWVTYMKLENGTVMYDVTNANWIASGFFNPAMLAPTSFRSVATTFYVAAFASSFGIPIFDSAFNEIGCTLPQPGCTTSLAGSVVRRTDLSAVKDYEAIAQYVRAQCIANTGTLPAEYNGTVPRRVVCTGTLCPSGF